MGTAVGNYILRWHDDAGDNYLTEVVYDLPRLRRSLERSGVTAVEVDGRPVPVGRLLRRQLAGAKAPPHASYTPAVRPGRVYGVTVGLVDFGRAE